MLLRVSLGVTFLLALVHLSVQQQDPCALPANFGTAWIGPPEILAKCFLSLPYNQRLALGTLQSLDHLVTLYSFTDIAKNSGGPYNQQVDLPAALAHLKLKAMTGDYRSDYAFQSDLMRLFNSLNDAHTIYMAPQGYSCGLVRPFGVELTSDQSGKHWVFKPGTLSIAADHVFNTLYGFKPSDSYGQEFVSINGQTPDAYFLRWAGSAVGNYKDLNVRFNAALRSDWAASPLSRFPIDDPVMDYSTSFDIKGQGARLFPNVAVCLMAPTSTPAMLQLNLNPLVDSRLSPYRSNKVIKDHTRDGTDVLEDQRNWMKSQVDLLISSLPKHVLSKSSSAKPSLSASKRYPSIIKAKDQALGTNKRLVEGVDFSGNPSNLEILQTTPSGSAAYMRYDDNVNPTISILKVQTFAPVDLPLYATLILTAIVDMDQKNISHLILDVQANGGGIICFADFLLTLISTKWDLDPSLKRLPQGLYDFRQSKLTDLIRKSSLDAMITTDAGFYNASDSQPCYPDALYKPRFLQRGGSWSNYTQQAYFPAMCSYLKSFMPPIENRPSNIMVLTDGACGSACALFLTQIQTAKIAKSVSFGGPQGATVPLATTSFAGGNVLNYPVVSMQANSADQYLLPQFPTTAIATWNQNEFYAADDLHTPREYLKRPADFHLDYWATLGRDFPNDENKPVLTTLYTSAMAVAWKMHV